MNLKSTCTACVRHWSLRGNIFLSSMISLALCLETQVEFAITLHLSGPFLHPKPYFNFFLTKPIITPPFPPITSFIRRWTRISANTRLGWRQICSPTSFSPRLWELRDAATICCYLSSSSSPTSLFEKPPRLKWLPDRSESGHFFKSVGHRIVDNSGQHSLKNRLEVGACQGEVKNMGDSEIWKTFSITRAFATSHVHVARFCEQIQGLEGKLFQCFKSLENFPPTKVGVQKFFVIRQTKVEQLLKVSWKLESCHPAHKTGKIQVLLQLFTKASFAEASERLTTS